MIDSIWSMGVRYGNVIAILNRYRAYRMQQGQDASLDNLSDLLAVFEELGVDGFIEQIGNRQKVSTAKGAATKGSVVQSAAAALLDLGIDSIADFELSDGQDFGEQVKAVWLGQPGQRSGTSWRYLRMLTGQDDVKPDRMVRRFVARASALARTLRPRCRKTNPLTSSAMRQRRLALFQRILDHEIWNYESNRASASTSPKDHL